MAKSLSFSEASALANSGDSSAQYALSSLLHQHRRFDESLHWLRLAAAQELIPAQLTLATFLIDGRQCPRDLEKAVNLLQPLASSQVQANLLLSEVYGFAALGGADRVIGLRYLLGAARLGDVGAMRQLALLCVLDQRWDTLRPLLNVAARGGDAPAVRALARCHAEGIGGAADEPGRAMDWLLLEQVLPHLAGDMRLPSVEVLHEEPRIQRLVGVIHPLVLDSVIYLAAPLVQRSQITDARSGEVRADPMRNSSQVTLGPRQHDHVLEALERCIGRVSGTPILHGEFLQVLRYRPGEEFKPHVDYFNESGPGAHRALADGGQRTHTLLMYLNDDYSGGTTYFPKLKLEIKGRRGDMLHFDNVGADGMGHKDSLHAGMPVVAGEKWLLSQWIRRDAYPARVAW